MPTLEIERGRHTSPTTPIEKLIYWHCKSVETEIHFQLNAMCTEQNRELLYLEITSRFPEFTNLDNFDKFQLKLCFSNEQLYTSVGKFIYICFQQRNALANDNA